LGFTNENVLHPDWSNRLLQTNFPWGVSLWYRPKPLIKKSSYYQEWLIIIGLSLLVILLRLPSLDHPFDNDSAANAYHARLIVQGEPLYGLHHPAHHLPGVYYTYALAFSLLGDNVWAVKFLLLGWTIATVYLLYRLGSLLIDWGAQFFTPFSRRTFGCGATAPKSSYLLIYPALLLF
jgi:hypothetical protein